MKKAFFYCVLILLPFVIMEGFFRLLPVSNPPYLLPVTAEHPVVHYQPNIEYLSSGGWNFSIRTRMRTNNFGYNNLWDYHPEDTTPLLMVIGDSFVEAMTVDSGKSAAEILNSAVSGRGRVYSIGVSGAALSQYLAFAEFSKNSFHPSAMAFFIIDNDFDESLLKYKAEPRFHYFKENGHGFELQRVDYQRSAIKTFLRKSALLRYVMFNLQAGATLERLRHRCRSEDPYACAAGSPAALEQRIVDSQRAVDYFLDQVPAKSGLGGDSIVFVVDALRPAMYSAETLLKAQNSYVSRMRQYFMKQARSRGYEILDMQPAFMGKHRLDNSRFEFPTNGHWNELGNRVVADEIRKSAVFTRIFYEGPTLTRTADAAEQQLAFPTRRTAGRDRR